MLLQRANGACGHEIAPHQKRRWQVFGGRSAEPFADLLFRFCGAEAGHHQQIAFIVKFQIVRLPAITNARQTQLHGIPAQAQHIHDLSVTHFEQILRGPFTDSAVIGGDRRQAHPAVTTVNEHAGFSNINGQIMNMGIVDAQ